VHDHQHDLLLVCPASSGNRLLHLAGGVFADRQTGFDSRHDRRATRLTELERRIGILGHEHLLDTHGHRPMLTDHLANTAEYLLQSARQVAFASANTAGSHIFTAMPGIAHYTVTGDTRAWVDAEDQSHAARALHIRPRPEYCLFIQP